MVTNWSVRLEKHQTIEIVIKVDFYAFLKCCIFQKFSRFFLNSPVFPGEIVNAVNFI